MDILTEIVKTTRTTIDERCKARSLEALKSEAASMAQKPISLSRRLNPNKPNIIAEFKRKSPSRPNINMDADPVAVAKAYEAGGAAAMSVLTETDWFAGSPEDLKAIRKAVSMPLLRKDFMIDPYQFYEARCMGADLVLLIARILEPQQIHQFTELAHQLGMEVLCEIHNREELEKVGDARVDFLGVNCRDLKKFQTNLDHLIDIADILPSQIPWVAESGIHGPDDLRRLREAGYPMFLIGEYLMKSGSTQETLEALVHA